MPSPLLAQLIGLVEDDYFENGAEYSRETREVIEAGLAAVWGLELEKDEADA